MSHVDSKDEKPLILPDEGKIDDSKESDKSNKNKRINDDYNEFDDDERDPLENKDMDDKEW